eukprot:1158873-Pelagomonas_calceolata.AAC.4
MHLALKATGMVACSIAPSQFTLRASGSACLPVQLACLSTYASLCSLLLVTSSVQHPCQQTGPQVRTLALVSFRGLNSPKLALGNIVLSSSTLALGVWRHKLCILPRHKFSTQPANGCQPWIAGTLFESVMADSRHWRPSLASFGTGTLFSRQPLWQTADTLFECHGEQQTADTLWHRHPLWQTADTLFASVMAAISPVILQAYRQFNHQCPLV